MKQSSVLQVEPAIVELLIDELGELRIVLAKAELREKEIKAYLKKEGFESGDGRKYRATLTESIRTVVAYKTICEKMKASRQMLAAHTKKVPTTTLRVTARKK